MMSANSLLVLTSILLDYDIEPYFEKEVSQKYLNLNSQTKSEMKISIHQPVDSNGDYIVHGRYGEQDIAGNLLDLCDIYLRRYAQKGFGSDQWSELCFREGLMEVTTEQVTTYQIKD